MQRICQRWSTIPSNRSTGRLGVGSGCLHIYSHDSQFVVSLSVKTSRLSLLDSSNKEKKGCQTHVTSYLSCFFCAHSRALGEAWGRNRDERSGQEPGIIHSQVVDFGRACTPQTWFDAMKKCRPRFWLLFLRVSTRLCRFHLRCRRLIYCPIEVGDAVFEVLSSRKGLSQPAAGSRLERANIKHELGSARSSVSSTRAQQHIHSFSTPLYPSKMIETGFSSRSVESVSWPVPVSFLEPP